MSWEPQSLRHVCGVFLRCGQGQREAQKSRRQMRFELEEGSALAVDVLGSVVLADACLHVFVEKML